MLPITTHRSFHIPHTLAIAAALLAMIAALGWNADAAESLAERQANPVLERSVDAGLDGDQERGLVSERERNCSQALSCVRDHDLLHLVLPALPSY